MSETKQIQTGYIVKEGRKVKSWKKGGLSFLVMVILAITQTDKFVISFLTNNKETTKKGELDMTHATKMVKVGGKKLMLEIQLDTARVFRLQFDDDSVQDRWYNTFNEFMEDYKNSRTGFSRYDTVDLSNFIFSDIIQKTDKGQIQTAIYTKTNVKYSVKNLLVSTLNSSEVDYIKSIHQSLQNHTCPYLIKTYTTFESDNLYFVMDEYSAFTLHSIIDTKIPLQKIKYFAAEILLAIQAIHKCNYIHMEINPETIMIRSDGHLMLTTPVGLRESYKCGYNYFAPEILEKKELSVAVDYWSYGALLYAMIFQTPPFFDENQFQVCKKIISEPVNFPCDSPPDVENFISEFLAKDVLKRNCQFDTLKLSPFFVGIDFEKFNNKEVPMD